ncbi:MAG: argininosuccinate lyase [Pseudomonadota bacterium]
MSEADEPNVGLSSQSTDQNKNEDDEKLWGGRFQEPTDAFVERFTASVSFDQRLAQVDIDGSLAHVRMLAKVGVLTDAEKTIIEQGLEEIRTDIVANRFAWRIDREDVHMNIEARLIELVGDTGKKLHTGRSRNDQVATDIRLFVRRRIDDINSRLTALQLGLVQLAEQHAATIMPGYTHLQAAQPITFGHHLMAWVSMLQRDQERLIDLRKRVNRLPLGAAALAGTSYPLDRQFVAEQLGFESVIDNSLDAVSDRDFAIEFASFAALFMMHCSRMCEELILWMSAPFRFIDLPDRFCTGSSIMPQKKNPDVPELIRGKTGRVYGNLISLLTLMKSQPLAYNKDNQEDKEPLFDSLNTVRDVLFALTEMLPNIQVNQTNMLTQAKAGFSTATDLADYLVKKGLPFRDAHDRVGRIVSLAIQKNCELTDISLMDMQAICSIIAQDVFAVITVEGSVAARNIIGGTAPNQVRHQTQLHRKRLQKL